LDDAVVERWVNLVAQWDCQPDCRAGL
jgi:hypothetical protein